MEPKLFYNQRLKKLNDELIILLKKKERFGWIRFFTGITFVTGIYIFWGTSLTYILIALLVFAVLFARIVSMDTVNKNSIKRVRRLIRINQDELKALDHDFLDFPDGHEFLTHEHFYAEDLDIFGNSSLYQYINRTTSDSGGRLLASWLLKPADQPVILNKQIAIKELSLVTEWRQQIQSAGMEAPIKAATESRIDHWLKSPDFFLNNPALKTLRFLIPVSMFILTGCFIFDLISWKIFSIALFTSWIFSNSMGKKIEPMHQQLSRMVEEMEVLSSTLEMIENKSFHSSLLQSIQNSCIHDKSQGSREVKNLKKIMERLDIRLNMFLSVPMEVYLSWSIHQVNSLEKWKKNNKEFVHAWFSAVANFEALNSLSNLAFNHPAWTFPLIEKEHFRIEGTSIGHPLIPSTKRVVNDIKMDHPSEIMLVTGSNMAGKSTYLRSIGVNIILAMTGAPVCAESFSVSPVQLISSMRIADNLAESTSTFYAELKKLKTIIDKVNIGENVFILLDEILRGTNSIDRHTGSMALLKQLIRKKAVGIVATHDLELAELKKDYPENILNYHFDVQVNKEELFFDYKLKEGVCTSMNASILMRKIGIEV